MANYNSAYTGAEIDAAIGEVPNKADANGYYAGLGAGTADQLVSPDGTTDNAAFNYRTTAGSQSVTSGNVQIKSIKGYAVADGNSLKFPKPTGIKTTGFNQWDEQTESGNIAAETGIPYGDANARRSKNYCKCLPNTVYSVTHTAGTNTAIFWYDASKAFISQKNASAGQYFTDTSPATAAFFKIRNSAAQYSGDVCVNISHSGSRNGQYEEYETPKTLAIDTATYFPNGMRKAGSVYDEMDFVRRKAVTRIGIVDLGSLTWTRVTTDVTIPFFQSMGLSQIAAFTNNNTPCNFTCSKYETKKWAGTVGTEGDKYVAGLALNGGIAITDTDYNDAATFKAAMNGVYMTYELATPTEVNIPASVNNIYIANDWGTEEWLQAAGFTAPVSATLIYMRNLVDEVRNMRNNLIEPSDLTGNGLMVHNFGDGTYWVGIAGANKSTINERVERQPAGIWNVNCTSPIVIGMLDHAVKAAMCDGVGAAWTDVERLAALLRMGCTVDANGFVKWTATPSEE